LVVEGAGDELARIELETADGQCGAFESLKELACFCVEHLDCGVVGATSEDVIAEYIRAFLYTCDSIGMAFDNA
jgi:hypothetical protein